MLKRNIALVNGPRQQCGIHSYALSVLECLEASEKFNFYLAEIGSVSELVQYLEAYDIDGIIYNYHAVTLPWLNSDITAQIVIPQFVITGHDSHVDLANTLATIHVDPAAPAEFQHPSPRPIVYYPDIAYASPQGRLRIGTSGFGHAGKSLPDIVRLINAEFANEHVDLRVHIPFGDYIDSTGGLARKLAQEITDLAAPTVHLDITHEFMEKPDLVRWLNDNDINVYLYNYATGNGFGVSASADLALAARKPLAMNDSYLFHHIYDPRLDLNLASIRSIIELGTDHLDPYYESWNPDTMVEFYEQVLSPHYEE